MQRTFLIGPAMKGGLFQSRPPALIQIAHYPVRVALSQPNQAISGPLFSRIVWVWTHNPVFGSLPSLSQSLYGAPDDFGAYLVGTQALFKANRQFQSPRAGGPVIVSGTLVQYLSQDLNTRVIENGPQVVMAVGFPPETSQAFLLKGTNHIAYGLAGTANSCTDLRKSLSLT